MLFNLLKNIPYKIFNSLKKHRLFGHQENEASNDGGCSPVFFPKDLKNFKIFCTKRFGKYISLNHIAADLFISKGPDPFHALTPFTLDEEVIKAIEQLLKNELFLKTPSLISDLFGIVYHLYHLIFNFFCYFQQSRFV